MTVRRTVTITVERCGNTTTYTYPDVTELSVDEGFDGRFTFTGVAAPGADGEYGTEVVEDRYVIGPVPDSVPAAP